jgi:molybdate/tungstate transport system ATP-binding protein
VNPEPLYTIHELRFAYDREAVSRREFDVRIDSLRINRGEYIAFVGENGAGKTTLLKLLNGLLEPSEGSIYLDGELLSSNRYARIRASSVLVHQQPYLFVGSVYANVSYGLKVRKISQRIIRRKVLERLALVGLDGFSHRKARELSGGEQQRVALARALVLEPEVLMLDEPTAHMDQGSIRQLREVLRKLRRQGTTLIMSSHQQEFAYRLADRLEVMEDGMLIPNRENIFKGEVVRRDERFMYFGMKGGELRCPDREGAFTTAVLSTNDIILSQSPIETSAQNQFRGLVKGMERYGSLVQVELDCGFPLKACITEYSLEHLGVLPGRELFATFKASALRLY